MPRPLPLPNIAARNDHDCGIAAWRTVYEWHFARDARVKDISSGIDGTHPAALEAVIRSRTADKPYRWHVISGEMQVEDLAHFAATQRPVICLVTPNDEGHYVTINGIWRGKVWYHDSDIVAGESGWTGITIQDFESIWCDYERRGRTFPRWGICAWPGT